MNVFPVQLLIATALMAVARKIVVLYMEKVSTEQLMGLAVVIVAYGVSYWLVKIREPE